MASDESTDESTASLAGVADELYALLPDEFTAARNARAKRLQLGDRALAKAVSELRRPAPAAWLVNQVVRHRADELEQLLQLGEQLRAAQADLDAATLTALARERRKVVGALARDAGRLARELGNEVRSPVIDAVAETLQAAMTDASAADAVRTGRLVRGLEAIGTEVDLDGAVAGGDATTGARPAPPRGGTPARDEVAERRARKQREDAETDREREEREQAEAKQAERERAERERAERAAAKAEERAVAAEQTAAEASARLDDAHAAADRAAETRDDLEAQVRELESKLSAAERELADAERAVRPLEREHERAARAADEARAAADELRADLD
jgi:hypothetical protein